MKFRIGRTRSVLIRCKYRLIVTVCPRARCAEVAAREDDCRAQLSRLQEAKATTDQQVHMLLWLRDEHCNDPRYRSFPLMPPNHAN